MSTMKQKKVMKVLSDNIGMPIGQAMRKVGYSKITSKTPQRLTNSKGWEELMEQHLPDKLLAAKHKELLMVPKKVRTFIKGDLSTEYEELDSNAVKAGLDMAYKLKGKYAAEKIDNPGQIDAIEQLTETVKMMIENASNTGKPKIGVS